MKVKKAVIPAAGFGTRFLPQTKAMPKQMLPIVDKPIIQYIVEMLVEVGIKDIILVTNYHERAIEDHFDSPHGDLIENLKMGGEKKRHLLEEVEKISELANFVYVRQKGPYGNGTPLINVRDLIGDEPFIYTWSDDFIYSTPNEFEQMIKIYEEFDCSVLASIKVRHDKEYGMYGISGGDKIREGLLDVKTIIEKPGKDNAPSDLANVSSFLFTPSIFNYLDEVLRNLPKGNEFYYNDALKLMLQNGERVLAAQIKGGNYYDTGSKVGYLKAVVDFALTHKELKNEFKDYIKETALKL